MSYYFEKNGPIEKITELIDEGYILSAFGIFCIDKNIDNMDIVQFEINDSVIYNYKIGKAEILQSLDVEITSLKCLKDLDQRFNLVGIKSKKEVNNE